MIDLDELVAAAILAARVNGYGPDLKAMTPHQLAIDLCTYDSELEKFDVGLVERAVVWFRYKEDQ